MKALAPAVVLWLIATNLGVAQDVEPVRQAREVALADGPYVSVKPDGWLARSISAEGVLELPVNQGRIEVQAVDGIPGFEVALRDAPAQAAPSRELLSIHTPLLVVADTHGEYDIFVAFLKAQGVVDDHLRWTFGAGHLAVLGDMLDRGPHQVEILWLLYQLEADARAAGGRVHVLIGNHEALVLRGDVRYLHPRYPEGARRLGASSYSALLGRETVLGAWLRARPAMLKLGDILLVHAGVSSALTESGLDGGAINAIVRRSLDTPHTLKAPEGSLEALVLGGEGPLWDRGYFATPDRPATATAADVQAALDHFGVSRILVGHTPVDCVHALYDGRVIAVQVYPHVDNSSGLPVLEGAIRLEGSWFRATTTGDRHRLNLIDPVGSG